MLFQVSIILDQSHDLRKFILTQINSIHVQMISLVTKPWPFPMNEGKLIWNPACNTADIENDNRFSLVSEMFSLH